MTAAAKAMAVDPLRNYDEWQKSVRNFADWLGDVVPGATDIDFMCERNSHFLIIEAKPWTGGVTLPYGQHLALFRLSAQPNTRVYLAGEDNEDRMHLVQYNGAAPPKFVKRKGKTIAFWPPDRFIPSSKDGLRALVAAWWEDAAA